MKRMVASVCFSLGIGVAAWLGAQAPVTIAQAPLGDQPPVSYALGPDSQPQPGVPKGTLTKHVLAPGKFFPGTPHNYQVFVPAQYDASRPIASQTLRMRYTDMRWLKASDAGKQFGQVRLTVYHQRCDIGPNTCPPNGPDLLPQYQRWDRVIVSTAPIGPVR